MILKQNNNLNIIVDSRLELLLAIHAAYKKIASIDEIEDYDWIEHPNINYVNNLTELIDIDNEKELIKYIKYSWNSCDRVPNLITVFDNNFNLLESKLTKEIEDSFSYGNIYDFAILLKKLSEKINWIEFFNKHIDIYESLLQNVISLPKNIGVNELIEFYGVKKNSYNYCISIFMNGGFGIYDNEDNLYCIRGYEYDEDKKSFIDFNIYAVENMFHEFSHPYVNPLIDKYFNRFNIEEILKESQENNLYSVYSKKPQTLLYEYFVRANALVLSKRYISDISAGQGALTHGFNHLQELADYIYDHKNDYQTFENLLVNELIDYLNSLTKLLEKDIKRK